MKRKVGKDTKPCKFDGCGQWAWAQGYCGPHYHKLKSQGLIRNVRIHFDDLTRFKSKYAVNPVTGCWEWTGSIHPRGYGMFYGGRTTQYRAHRWSYEHHYGPIPEGLMVLHSCDVRRCVNPHHLSLGTGEDNLRDASAKGRLAAQNGLSGKKISDAMALNVRIMYARGEHSMNVLSRIYGVEARTISDIVKGRGHLRIC